MVAGGSLSVDGASARGGLVARLFTGAERWGWEFVPAPENDEHDPPRWREPVDVTVAWWEKRRRARRVPLLSLGVGAISYGGWLLPVPAATTRAALAVSVLVVGLALIVVREVVLPRARLAEAGRVRDRALDRYRRQIAAWQSARLRHDVPECWFPLRTTAARVDVFGGTGDGWAGLVTTVGSSLLRAGSGVLVVDLSEQRTADGLAAFAGAAGYPVSGVELSHDHAGALLAGLPPDEVVEVVVGAVATLRGPAADADLVDADLLTTVTRCLDAPITFARLAAGLRVVRGHHDPGTGSLSRAEVHCLTGRIDAAGATERTADALRALTGLVDLLGSGEAGATTGDPLTWPGPGLTVLATTGAHARRKDFLDRVLFHRVLHAVRGGSGRDALFVIGADHLGLTALEALARRSRRVGARLVLVLEHLRGDLGKLLGAGDGTTIVMRLGNHEEARTAAEFIGREHTFGSAS